MSTSRARQIELLTQAADCIQFAISDIDQLDTNTMDALALHLRDTNDVTLSKIRGIECAIRGFARRLSQRND